MTNETVLEGKKLVNELLQYAGETSSAFRLRKITQFNIDLFFTYNDSFINKDPDRDPKLHNRNVRNETILSVGFAIERPAPRHTLINLFASSTREIAKFPDVITAQLSPKMFKKCKSKNLKPGMLTERQTAYYSVDSSKPTIIDFDLTHSYALKDQDVVLSTARDFISYEADEMDNMVHSPEDDAFNKLIADQDFDSSAGFSNFDESAAAIRSIINTLRTGTPPGL